MQKKAKYKIEEVKNKKVWEDFVLSQNPKSFLHSWNWGETNKLMGEDVVRLGLFKAEELVGTCLLIRQEAKRGHHFIVPGGPLINWEDKKLTRLLIAKLKKIAKDNKMWFIRVRPELLDNEENRKLFLSLGFRKAPMHLHAENTLLVDISRSNEEILYSMRKNTRYLVRKSLKMNLKFEICTNPADYKILAKLQKETARRHKFAPFPDKLFKFQLETFAKDEQAGLFMVKRGKEVLAAAIIIFYSDTAYYHHSASVSKYREIPFSYFLQWHIIQHAKKKKCKYYNLWGIAPTDSKRHRFAGVTVFKRGFGGETVNWLKAHDLPTSRLYWLTYTYETLRRTQRRL